MLAIIFVDHRHWRWPPAKAEKPMAAVLQFNVLLQVVRIVMEFTPLACSRLIAVASNGAADLS
jgi:hypothetical protein